MTPIFSRIWLMKMRTAPEREMAAVSLRSACDMRRACSPGSESPMSPSRPAGGSERDIERQRTRRDDGDLLQRAPGAQAHDGTLAELPLDLRDRQLQRLSPVALRFRHARLLVQ